MSGLNVDYHGNESALPEARGPITLELFRALRRPPAGRVEEFTRAPHFDDAIYGEDTTLALYCLYELHYRGFSDVSDEWEWDPNCIELRRQLERRFLHQLRGEVEARYGNEPVSPTDVVSQLRALTRTPGPSLSSYMEIEGTRSNMREFCIHRSAYQRKEADPHTWAIPRLQGQAKAALVLIQFGEYGDGCSSNMHAELFRSAMEAMNLDSRYGALLDLIPGSTLSTVNLVSLFGLNRLMRGALVGHLALFEMCSVGPMGRYVAALERLGMPDAIPFYIAHVEADVIHESVALDEMVGGLLADEPNLSGDILFGARSLDLLERNFATQLLSAWAECKSSLRFVVDANGSTPSN